MKTLKNLLTTFALSTLMILTSVHAGGSEYGLTHIVTHKPAVPPPADPIFLSAAGIAELKALHFHQNLPGYLAGCLKQWNPCNLLSQEMASLQLLIANHAKEIEKITVQFDPQLPAPIATLPSYGAEIKISTRALYTMQGSPESTDQIAALVLAARWSHVAPAPLPFLLKRSLEILGSLEDEIVQESVGGNNSPVTFYLSHWNFKEIEHILFLLEDSKDATDITELVQKSLPCGKLLDWQWSNVRSYAKASGMQVLAAVAVEGASKCFGGRPQNLVIEMVVRENRVLKDQIRVSVRGL